MTAKPQQMSGQPDTSEDLIAELAKLMATNAKPEPIPALATRPEPAIKPVAAPSVRIPGSEPALAAAPRPIRIPGMDQPVPGVPDQPAAEAKPVPAQTQPAAEPILQSVPRPVEAWQERAERAFERKPGGDAPAEPARREPVLGLVSQPAPQPAPTPAAPAPFDFKFDIGAGQQPAAEQPAKTPEPAIESDPIGDLIAAELGMARSAPTPVAVKPAPAVIRATPSAGAPVKFAAARPAGAMPPPASSRPSPASLAPQGRMSPATPITLRPVHGRAIPAESDAFAIAPGFGLAGKPGFEAPQPKAQPVSQPAQARSSDPMLEIENLIGDAVRLDLQGDRPEEQPKVDEPLVRSPFETARAKEPEARTGVVSAEDAILAAAAATGAEVGRIEPEPEEQVFRPGRKERAMRPGFALGGVRQLAGIAVALTLLVAAGFGLYWVIGMGRGDGTVPVLTADSTPVKQAPAIVQSNVAETRSVVLDELDGVTMEAGAETLVSTDQTANVAVAEVVAPPVEITESGLANRKVRTVTVRPDGTIVSGDDAVAGSEALSVARPNVPEVPGANVEPSELLTAAVNSVTPDPIAAAIANPDASAAGAIPAVEVSALAPTTGTGTLDLAPTAVVGDPNAPIPMPRMMNRPTEPTNPSVQPTSPVNAVITEPLPTLETAVTSGGTPIDLLAPAEQPAPPVAVAAVEQPRATAAAYVQLSSQRSEQEAMASLNNIKSRFGTLLGGSSLEIHRADLGQKGIFYRVWLPASSRGEANSLCSRLVDAGAECFVP